MKFELSKSNLEIFLLIIVYLIMWLPIQDISFIGYLDEIFTLVLLILLIFRLKINRENSIYIFSIIGFLLIGIVSTIKSEVPQSNIARLLDCFAFIKLPTVFLYFRYVYSNTKVNKVINILLFLSKIVVIVSSIFGIANLFLDFGMSYDYRYGLRSFKFFYNNPGTFVALMSVCFSIINLKKNRLSILFKILIVFNLLITLRSVAFGIVLLILLLPIIIKKGLKLYQILLTIPFIVFAGYSAISNYFIEQVTPRSILLKYGILVAKRFFPFGSGFATYGSNAARDYYSTLYYEFGFNKVWGLSPQAGHILNDNFWPMIIAQFGLLGLSFYLVFIFAILKPLFNKKLRKNSIVSGIILLSFLIISSLGANVVTGVLGVLIIIPYSLIINEKEV